MIARQVDSVSVLTTFPQYPTGYARDRKFEGKCILHEIVDGFTTVRLRMPPLAHKGWVNRLIVFAFFIIAAVVSIPVMRRSSRHPDVVFALAPALLACIPSYVIARLYQAKLVMDVPDLWPEEFGILKGPSALIFKSVGGLLARWVYKLPDYVTVATGPCARTIEEKYGLRRVSVIHTGADTARFRPIAKVEARAYLRQAGILPANAQTARILLYIGLIGPAYKLLDLVNTITSCRDRNVVLVMVGDGEDRDMLRARINATEAANIILVDPRPREEIPKFICAADLCLIPSMNDAVSAYAVPTKFFEYLACGRPVACSSSQGIMPTLVRQFNVGVVVDTKQLVEVLGEMSEEDLESMGERARLAANQFSISSMSEKMGEIVETVCRRDNRTREIAS
jgi:glycosyltransferase involved in cell wall biosynthesis